jgi:Ribosomal protein L7/L12 C-terminal domain
MTWTPTESFGFAALAVLGLILLAGIGARLNGIRSRIAVLSRMEAKLDLLLKQANIKFDPYASVPLDIVQALRAGRKIEAIKLYRQASGVGLKEAKDYVEEVERRAGTG